MFHHHRSQVHLVFHDFLGQELCEVGLLPTAVEVLDELAHLEVLEGGVAADLVLLGQLALLGGVDLAQGDVGVLLRQLPGGLGVLGGEGLGEKKS